VRYNKMRYTDGSEFCSNLMKARHRFFVDENYHRSFLVLPPFVYYRSFYGSKSSLIINGSHTWVFFSLSRCSCEWSQSSTFSTRFIFFEERKNLRFFVIFTSRSFGHALVPRDTSGSQFSTFSIKLFFARFIRGTVTGLQDVQYLFHPLRLFSKLPFLKS
jgi:hypothetical protein